MTTAQNPDALPVVAWRYKTAHTTHLCHSRLDHYFSNDEGETYIKGDALVLQADHEASLLAKEAECEALRVKAARYDWLREQAEPNRGGEKPWCTVRDNKGHAWAFGGSLDAAIDAARAAADQGGAS